MTYPVASRASSAQYVRSSIVLMWRQAVRSSPRTSKQLLGRVDAQVGALGKVIAQQPVHVLVRAALPE
jgi:hypothetical protein